MRTPGLLLSSMAVAVLLTTGCGKLRRDRLHIGNTAAVTLKGSSYTIQWVCYALWTCGAGEGKRMEVS